MRYLFAALAGLVLVATAWQLYQLEIKKWDLENQLQKSENKLAAIQKENLSLAKEIDFFKNSESLKREAKAQLNYVAPGEKLIVVVPAE